MPRIIWRCECGAAYEMQEERFGSRVRCRQCGAVSLIEKPSRTKTPPPLPKASVPSMEGSGKRSIAPGNSAEAVNRESKKPELFQPVILVAAISGTGTLVLLLLLVLVFRGGSTPQRQAENAQPRSVAPEMDNPREPLPSPDRSEGKGETDRPFPTPKESQNPPADVQSNMPTGKVLVLEDLAELVGPSVVQVNVTGAETESTGSGFVLDKQGTIVTNYHVIEDATAGTIIFSDRTSAPITGYLGVWPEKDIALIRVECSPDKLHPLRLATSAPRQGERVAAFGSPLGLQQTVTDGIVSAIRESEELQTIAPIDIDALLIQTTAPSFPGNSGGPLMDMKGMVVGVNTMGLHGEESLNFAVAIAELPPLLLAMSEIASPLPAPYAAGSGQRILSRAKDHHDAGDYDIAIADFTEAIRLDPTRALNYHGRGESHRKKMHYDLAIADFTEAIRLDPNSVYFFASRAQTHHQNHDYDSAIADYSEAIRLDPENSFYYTSRGLAYEESDYDRAIADYTAAIRISPNSKFAYHFRGALYGRNEHFDNAIADFTEVIRLDAEYVSAFRLRGMAHQFNRDDDLAIADYTEAIRLDSTDAEAYWWRGKAYEQKGRQAQAERDFAQATKLGYKP